MNRSRLRAACALAALVAMLAVLPPPALAVAGSAGGGAICAPASHCPGMSQRAHARGGSGSSAGCDRVAGRALGCCGSPIDLPAVPGGRAVVAAPQMAVVAAAGTASVFPTVAARARRDPAADPLAAPATDLFTLHSAFLI